MLTSRSKIIQFLSRRLSFNGASECVQVKKKITAEDVRKFSELSGDTNPIHSGENAIVHGAFLNGLVSGVIGTRLPGPGSIVISQTLNFPNKCFVDEEVVITVKVVERRKITKVEFQCETENKQIVLFGDARLIVPKR